MISENELRGLMGDLESDRIERTRSTKDTTKFREAICAFSNDFPEHRLSGFLLIGVDDRTGHPTGLQATDRLLTDLAGLWQDGEILPTPAMEVYKISLSDGTGDVVVAEVHPTELPPVRYKGRVYIRVGPRKAVANETEERILSERRLASAKTFDARACPGTSLDDLTLDVFLSTYRKEAIAADVLKENNRTVEEQLASLRFFNLSESCPTNAGILLFSRDGRSIIPGAYVQYLRIDGKSLSDDVKVDREYSGDLLTLARELDNLLEGTLERHPVEASALREELVWDYPPRAVRELLLNAIIHRDYESNSPVRFYRFEDRIEIQNPGGLYGDARPENFPRANDYRNPILAESMKILGYVNRFGRGVYRAQDALATNGNPPPEFEFQPTFTGVVIRRHEAL